jgi:hypothetical protein
MLMAATVMLEHLLHKLSTAEADILLHRFRGSCRVTGEDTKFKITLIITSYTLWSP